MSSRSSPSIEIDCRLPAAARSAVFLACAVAALIPWLMGRGFLTAWASLVVAAILLVGFAAAGWLGGARALKTATWSAEGTWWLTDDKGGLASARLLPDSRVYTHWLWLRWETPAGKRQALLSRHSVEADVVRRLATRLRLQGARPVTASDSLRM